MNPKYLIRASADPRGPVELWSEARLPFEPKGELVEMRDELREAVRMLRASREEVLHAIYISESTSPVDAENALLYNVGAGPFQASSRTGVRFERLHAPCPKPPTTVPFRPLHYARYWIAPLQSSFVGWNTAGLVGRWRTVRIPRLDGLLRPSALWLGMKRAEFETIGTQPQTTFPFGLRVSLTQGWGDTRNTATMLKPLLDGIVAALHSHDGSDIGPVSERLASQLGIPAREAGELLRESSCAVLGPRRLLWMWGQSLQWNPADDACVAAEVIVADSPSLEGEWTHSGEIEVLRSSLTTAALERLSSSG